MNKAMLDTDIYSECLKAVDQKLVQKAMAYRQVFGFVTLSAITVMEIVQGLQRVRATRQIQLFRDAIAVEEILLFDQVAADLAGQIAGDLDRIGRPIGRCDPMIAAMAIQAGLDLVTGNTAHYQRIQDLGYPLKLDNWRS